MTERSRWTPVDETIHFYARTMEEELRRTHGILFAAAFLDEFEPQIRNVAVHSIVASMYHSRKSGGH